MASVARRRLLERLRNDPFRGLALAAEVVIVWIAGAMYCAGYEGLTSGHHNWGSSLIWSAGAILPWLALFEWSKSRVGRSSTAPPINLALLLIATALVSLSLEFATDVASDARSTPVALAMLRRLPAIGACLILILWARTSPGGTTPEAAANLATLASSIEWAATADNYIELHVGQRVLMRRMTMAEAERALRSRGFVRIHRRFLVNRERIASVEGNGTQTLTLVGGTELPIGRRYAGNLHLHD